MMKRAYYSNPLKTFLQDNNQKILGEMVENHEFALEDLQRNAWMRQIEQLKEIFEDFNDGYIFFEYAIPRMGKRVDVIVIFAGIIFVIEYKVGATTYPRHAVDQVLDYALDLKNFHEESHDKPIIPILVCTNAHEIPEFHFEHFEDNVFRSVNTNGQDLNNIILRYSHFLEAPHFEPAIWQNSLYKPTPTIIEAAQALYRGHNVEEISRSDAGAINLSRTSDSISKIIDQAKVQNKKIICFVTGVPGAGKTLAGLNIANERLQVDENEHSVFLSGNGPLVFVLREALARGEVETAQFSGNKLTKKKAISKAQTFIQNIHHFRDDALTSSMAPLEKVVVFDEAQRAWTLEQTASFMKRKKGVSDFSMSEPAFLISVMDRHVDWAVIVCLIGGGQEINTGEAGLLAWFNAIEEKYPHWEVYASDTLSEFEYTRGYALSELIRPEQFSFDQDLHLSVSIRSFRSEKVSQLIKLILDNEPETAKKLYDEIKENYPIVISRNLDSAKEWLREKARGSERFGLLASSGGYRLKPVGIHVKSNIDVTNWFLNGKDDIRSSYFLEDAATEFDIQGLELDWTCVAWDADLRYGNLGWQYKNFRGASWQNVNDETRRLYLKNAYRVLLTRARQGMVIFVQHGDSKDKTRKPSFYDGTFNYLKAIGFEEIG